MLGGASSVFAASANVCFIWDASHLSHRYNFNTFKISLQHLDQGSGVSILLNVMESSGLNTCTKTVSSSAILQPADLSDPRVPKEQHVWPTLSSKIPSSAILKPLSFPETPKEDLSLFTDSSKDQPICCLICDRMFSSHRDCDCDSLSKSEHTQNLLLSETTTMERNSDMGMALKAGAKDVVESSGERVERVREKEALSLQPKDEWLRHLLLEHKIVIHQVSEICSLKWYDSKYTSRLHVFVVASFPCSPTLPALQSCM